MILLSRAFTCRLFKRMQLADIMDDVTRDGTEFTQTIRYDGKEEYGNGEPLPLRKLVDMKY